MNVKGMMVVVQDESIMSLDRALQELKQKLKKNNVMQDLKQKEFYMSPSRKRRFKKNEAKKRSKREARKQEWYNTTNKDKSF